MTTGPKILYEFGPFRLDPERQQLLRESQPIAITPKAFETLLILVQNSREVVSKEDLMKELWPDVFVEEANLSQNIFMLRKALGDTPEDRRYIVTLPGRGYRFAGEVRTIRRDTGDLVIGSHMRSELLIEQTNTSPEADVATMPELSAGTHRKFKWKYVVSFCAFIAVLCIGTGIFLLGRRPAGLGAKDSILIADFTNTTGDPVFDNTLRQGFSIQLEQSPFLSLIPDQRIRQTLRLMNQLPDTRITQEIAHDLCQRTQSAAYLTGSIASLGSQYVLGLKAYSCPTGDVLAEQQETAADKEKVLAALDGAAAKLRRKLGESLNTVQKFDTPLEQATTPSLEALQAYTLGRRTQAGRDEFAAAVPFYQRAIRFDPNFSIAFAALGVTYNDLGETLLGAANLRKAFELRASISEPEKFYVESAYYHYALGDLDKAFQIYRVWAQIYPRNSTPRIRLCELYKADGKYEDALTQIREAIRLDPLKGVSFGDLVENLIDLEQFQEAGTTAQYAIDEGVGSRRLRADLYQLAFLENDAPGMVRQAESVAGDPDAEAKMFELRAETAAYSGRLKESRDLTRKAVAAARHAEESETAASFEVNAALREALFGNETDVHLHAGSPPGGQMGRRAEYVAALSSAIAGDTARAQALADDLARRYPDDTLVQFNFLLAIRAQIALERKDPSKAVELLQSTAPYELSDAWWGFLGPVYVRGEAYLMAHKGGEAAAEFRKIVDHRGILGNSPSGALAHLQLGRAYAINGDTAPAKAAYQEFLTLWKNADPDIPVLKQARSEYAKLQ